MINEEHTRQLLGRDMLDRDEDRIGEITGVFVDDRTGEPTWVTVKTGWFGMSQSFVPLNKVRWSGNQVRAAYDTDTVKDAPRFAPDQPLTARDEDALYAHYGLSATSAAGDSQPREAPGSLDIATEDTRTVPAGSRGRLRRYDASTGRFVAAGTDMGDTRVCGRCGAYVAPDMLDRHDTFHDAVTRAPGNYARHDVEITEHPGHVVISRQPGDYARHDVVTEPASFSTDPNR